MLNKENNSAKILAQIFTKNYSVERKGNTRLIFKDGKREEDDEYQIDGSNNSRNEEFSNLRSSAKPFSAGVPNASSMVFAYLNNRE